MTTATRPNQPASRSHGAGAPPSPGANPLSAIARQAAQELLPRLTSRLLDAASHRALSTVDGLTNRLETVAADRSTAGSGGLKAVLTGKPTDPDNTGQNDHDSDESDAKPSLVGKIGSGLHFVVQQAIALLERVKQWIIQALAAARHWLGRASESDAEDGDTTEHDQDGGDGEDDRNQYTENQDDEFTPDESDQDVARSR